MIKMQHFLWAIQNLRTVNVRHGDNFHEAHYQENSAPKIVVKHQEHIDPTLQHTTNAMTSMCLVLTPWSNTGELYNIVSTGVRRSDVCLPEWPWPDRWGTWRCTYSQSEAPSGSLVWRSEATCRSQTYRRIPHQQTNKAKHIIII